jgi:thioredoxin-like negative regulator of GroEL
MRNLESNNIGLYVMNGPHILYFCSEWSNECKRITQIFNELDSDIDVIKVSVEIYNDICTRFRIQSVPTLFFYKDGICNSKLEGNITKEAIEAEISKL